MQIFPVTNSTLSGPHLAQLLISAYGFSESTKCTIFRTGINDSYMVHDGEERYVLRVYSFGWRSEAEIREEIRLLNLLYHGNILVSRPIPLISGDYLQAITAPEGQRYAVLFSFVEGKKVRNLSENQCVRIGEIMGDMHALTVGKNIDRIRYDSHSLLEVPYQTTLKFFDESLEEMKFIKDMSEIVQQKFEEADGKQFRSGIVHMDMWYDNMSIAGENQISIFDFDFCGNGWLMFDITYFVMQLFHIESDKDIYKTKLEHFLEGYQKKQPVSDAEMKLIPYAGFAIWIFYLGVQASRFDNWSNVFFTENYLKHFIGLSKKWLEFHQIKTQDIA